MKYGGDDILELFYHLLKDRIRFPYKECDLARAYDRNILEFIFESFCTVNVVGGSSSIGR